MAFSQTVKDQAYIRAGGMCECTRTGCGHKGRCYASLSTRSGWHAHHIHADSKGGADTLSNCEALCVDCHANTYSYGRS